MHSLNTVASDQIHCSLTFPVVTLLEDAWKPTNPHTSKFHNSCKAQEIDVRRYKSTVVSDLANAPIMCSKSTRGQRQKNCNLFLPTKQSSSTHKCTEQAHPPPFENLHTACQLPHYNTRNHKSGRNRKPWLKAKACLRYLQLPQIVRRLVVSTHKESGIRCSLNSGIVLPEAAHSTKLCRATQRLEIFLIPHSLHKHQPQFTQWILRAHNNYKPWTLNPKPWTQIAHLKSTPQQISHQYHNMIEHNPTMRGYPWPYTGEPVIRVS